MGLCSGKLPDAAAPGTKSKPRIEGYRLDQFVSDAMLPVEGYCFRLPPSEEDLMPFQERTARINALTVLSLYQKGKGAETPSHGGDTGRSGHGSNAFAKIASEGAVGMMRGLSKGMTKLFHSGTGDDLNASDDKTKAVCFFRMDAAEVDQADAQVVDLSEGRSAVNLHIFGKLHGIAPPDSPENTDSDSGEEKALDILIGGMENHGPTKNASKSKKAKEWVSRSLHSLEQVGEKGMQAGMQARKPAGADLVDVDGPADEELVPGTWTLQCKVNAVLEREGAEFCEERVSAVSREPSVAQSTTKLIKVRCLSIIIDASEEYSGDPVQQSWLPTEDILRDIEAALNCRMQLSLNGLESPTGGWP